ncbi:hypothetical protein AB1M95_17955 [Sulfitobacter sp. LCG007]
MTITGNGGETALADLEALEATEGASRAIERGTLSQFAGLLVNEKSGVDFKLVNAGGGPKRTLPSWAAMSRP